MKKLVTILSAIALLAMLASCGKKVKKAKQEVVDNIPTVKVVDSMGPAPEWIEMEGEVGNHQGSKVIFFVGYGESKFKDTAKEAAQLNAATSAAVAIKAVATKQVARAWESIGAGDDETKEQVMKGLEALSSKNVDVSGMMKAGNYWRQVVKPNIVNGKVQGWSQPVFEFYTRYAMPYDFYEARRDGVVSQTKKEVKLNDRQKKLYADMESKLDELDAAAE